MAFGSNVRRIENTKAHGCVGDYCGDCCLHNEIFVKPGTTYKFDGGQFICHEDFTLDALVIYYFMINQNLYNLKISFQNLLCTNSRTAKEDEKLNLQNFIFNFIFKPKIIKV